MVPESWKSHGVFIKVNLDCVTVYDDGTTISRNFGNHSPSCTTHLTEDRIVELRLNYVFVVYDLYSCRKVVTDYRQSIFYGQVLVFDLSTVNCSRDYKRD